MQVGLSIPEVALLSPQPPLSGQSVREALIASSETFVTGATVRCDSDFNPEMIFVLGDTEIEQQPCCLLAALRHRLARGFINGRNGWEPAMDC